MDILEANLSRLDEFGDALDLEKSLLNPVTYQNEEK